MDVNMETAIVRVVDIPEGATAAEAERLLNEPCRAGFYLVQVLALGTSTASRAFFKRRLSNIAESRRNRDGMEAMAVDLIKVHPELTCRALVDLLKERGIERKLTWVWKKRAELSATGVAHASAL
jgi:hypothetical protein